RARRGAPVPLLRGVGVPGPGHVQGRRPDSGVHADRCGRDGHGHPHAGALRRRVGVMPEPTPPRPQGPSGLAVETVAYEKVPPRATIRLDRPEVLNAFDFRMLRELARAAEDASWDDSIRVVVLTGAGRAFCGGADPRA